jgi:hypothetical protein
VNREEAKARHPSNYFHHRMEAIWTVEDFDRTVADAQAVVEAGKRRLRVVGEDERGAPQFLFTRSRERRARRMDRLAVALLMLLMAALGCVVLLASAPHAKADVDNVVFAYANTYGSAVCETLDDGHDSVDGLTGIMRSIIGDGLTPRQAGQVVAISVTDSCPQYTPLLRAFIASSKAAVA